MNTLDEPHAIIPREEQLKLIRNALKVNIEMSHNGNKERYNLRSRSINYTVGQLTYRRNFAQSTTEKKFNAKLAPIFLPAKIKKKVGKVYYELEDLDGKFIGTFHAMDLRP
ncbi:uncharacterized protein LOC131803636 [Musca domestica]|uniref:Uncharacterized protein LOC131803636 n=1 Tax=Musca domestica TaxID=7370 RepID=A0ABM3V5I1_MUSDO|nr:uncharacterized protein LOC131803636 [Musca domestica]